MSKDLTPEEAIRVRTINEIKDRVGKILAQDYPDGLSVIMALSDLSAHTALHDGAGEEELVQIVRMSFQKSRAWHQKNCRGDA